ncbi:MAG: putative metal-binding motif-containing protein [Pseudomonadota bacterium]|nr:putative metal-binding motif-containing protein [Pseudomonadota bacterium]
MRVASLSMLALALGAPALAASPGQADICHWDADTASVITVSVRAVPAHVSNHGDSYAALYFFDADGDGYGDAAAETDRCPNEGFVANNTDCDDTDASVSPGATEVPYDGVDNDCADGTRDDDLDNDGFLLADDCDDTDASVNPGAEDVCDDGVDNNCDDTIDENCAGDCPCYTTADIDAAYAEYLDTRNHYADANWSNAQCYEYDYDYVSGPYSYSENSTHLYFDAFSGDISTNSYYYEAYERSWSRFYGVSFEQDWNGSQYARTYCNAYSNDYSYDGTTYTSNWQQNFLDVTEAEAEACEAVVIAWAADNSMTCASY